MASDLSPPPPAPSRSDSTVSALRRQIVRGDFPPGERLAEAAVARRLGVSRVPVREALFTLEREGLVEFSVSGRAFVKDLTPDDFEELYLLRMTLEPLAARLAANAFKADATALEENIAATAKARELSEITRLDLEFHELILRASGNSRLLKLWASLRGELELWLGRLHRSNLDNTRQTLTQTVDAHREIVNAFRTQKPAACERLLSKHIFGWREWLPLNGPAVVSTTTTSPAAVTKEVSA